MAKKTKDAAAAFDLDDHDAMETLVEKAIGSIDELDASAGSSVDKRSANIFDELDELEEIEEEDENIHVSTVRYATEDVPLHLEDNEPKPRPTAKKPMKQQVSAKNPKHNKKYTTTTN